MTWVYIYWYPKICNKCLIGLERFEVGTILNMNSQFLKIYKGIRFWAKKNFAVFFRPMGLPI